MNIPGPAHRVELHRSLKGRSLSLPVDLLATAPGIYPASSRSCWKNRLQYVLSGLAAPRVTSSWFGTLSQPPLDGFARLNPRLLIKLQRPYLHVGLDPAGRLDALQAHYRFAVKTFSAATFAQLLTRPGIVLADLALEGLGAFSLRLLYANKYEKEGELTVALHDGDRHEFLVALTFSINAFGSQAEEMFIGGLQGNQIPDQRARIVALTRALHGLRPKALLLIVAQELAACWQVERIRAVSNRNAAFRDRWLEQQGIHADYDRFWQESGAQNDADGNFTLPARFIPRDMASIAPSKRGQHRRRYELQGQITQQVRQHLRLISTSGPTADSP